MTRPSLDQIFMETATLFRLRGTCKRGKVGAVLVKDNRIISTGYNGSPSGMPHCTDIGCTSESHCIRTIHAEANAVLFAAKNGMPTYGTTLYVTVSPCIDCAKMLIAAGVNRVVYLAEYRDTLPIALLNSIGIKTEAYNGVVPDGSES